MRSGVQDRVVLWPSERRYRMLIVTIIVMAIIGLVVFVNGVVEMLVRGNLMYATDYTAGTGAWLTEEHWCPDGNTVKPQGRYERWLTFGRGYPVVVVAGGTADGPFAYTIFRDVPPGARMALGRLGRHQRQRRPRRVRWPHPLRGALSDRARVWIPTDALTPTRPR